MKDQEILDFVPLSCLFELTYRCNLDCAHCYCKGSENKNKELSTKEFKSILDQIAQEGVLHITLSGGEPLLRDDFREIYLYAKRIGFVVEVFTNGLLINKQTLDLFEQYPPAALEITLNGITKEVYESITQIPGSFERIMFTIKEIAAKDLPLVLKANCLKQNQHEIAGIKRFSEDLFGSDKKRFKFDPLILPRLNGDKTPCQFRLSPGELKEVFKAEDEIREEHKNRLSSENSLLREKDFLFQCNSWMKHFFINPYGRLKFCQFINKYSVDIKRKPFKDNLYGICQNLLKEKFKTVSKCKNCSLRQDCYHCPGRAYVEIGDFESPVEYFCELASSSS